MNEVFNAFKKEEYQDLTNCLRKKLKNAIKTNREIVVLCIGTDRISGDSLGPLLGSELSKNKFSNVFIYGTLEEPAHFKNLQKIVEEIYKTHLNPFVIAIDATLTSSNRTDRTIGDVVIIDDGIKPGLALDKDSMKIGDMSILGIVNEYSGFEDSTTKFSIITNTRLYYVKTIVDMIFYSLTNVFSNIKKNKFIS